MYFTHPVNEIEETTNSYNKKGRNSFSYKNVNTITVNNQSRERSNSKTKVTNTAAASTAETPLIRTEYPEPEIQDSVSEQALRGSFTDLSHRQHYAKIFIRVHFN